MKSRPSRGTWVSCFIWENGRAAVDEGGQYTFEVNVQGGGDFVRGIRTCLPKINYVEIRPSGDGSERSRWIRTYDELAFTREIARLDALDGVVGLALAESGAVDIGGEEADGGEDAGVEGGLC